MQPGDTGAVPLSFKNWEDVFRKTSNISGKFFFRISGPSERARGAESRGSMDKAGQVWEAWQELVIGRADPIVVMTTSMLAIAAVPVVLTWLSMRRHKKREGKKEDEEAKPEAKPSHHGNLTKEELKEYTGKDSSKPLLVAINGKIYDVTSVSQTLSRARALLCHRGC